VSRSGTSVGLPTRTFRPTQTMLKNEVEGHGLDPRPESGSNKVQHLSTADHSSGFTADRFQLLTLKLPLVVIAVVSVFSPVILMIPVALMQRPALLVMIVVRMVPIRAFIWWTIPSSCHPLVMSPIRRPVPVNPCVAGTGHCSARLDAQRWRRNSDIHANLRRSGNGKSDGKK
jgi:hypothetical protein